MHCNGVQTVKLSLWVSAAGLVPELHAGAPGADVLAQQQVVKGNSVDAVEELPDRLTYDLRVQTVVSHDVVELPQLLDQGLQGVAGGAVGVHVHAGRTVPVAHRLHACQAGDALALQHGRHWMAKQKPEKEFRHTKKNVYRTDGKVQTYTSYTATK